ncbi:hypothetical protein HD806DRAFT_534092 [Xylariaceae sp. AK1471]|nr:hypothetical protein HD806DRAFT_534092 [Xylariaceae sp. AK1471]
MRFQSPQLGALGVTFTALRGLQFVSLVTVVGLTANFINEFASSQREVPDVLVGTVIVTSISTLYVAISYILYYDGMLPLLVAGGIDLSLLVGMIVVAVTIGKPLSMLQCELLPQPASPTATFVTSITTRSYASAAAKYNSYLALITTDQPHCYEIKAVWGLGIALSVLFSFSALVCGCAGVRGGFGAAPVEQISGPTALGTRILSPGFGSRFPPPLSLPEASHRRPLRGIDGDDFHHVPTPPIMVNANVGPSVIMGRSLTDSTVPPAQHLMVPPPASSPHGSSLSPTEDFIPILHQPVPKLGKTPAKTPMLVVVPPSTPSDDGFTPVTPSPSRLKGFKLARVSQLPRDALGIATAGFTRKKSQRAIDEYEDTAPLSPYSARSMDVPSPVKAKPKRKTLFGVLEGWWDLGLLERGKSLRRKG